MLHHYASFTIMPGQSGLRTRSSVILLPFSWERQDDTASGCRFNFLPLPTPMLPYHAGSPLLPLYTHSQYRLLRCARPTWSPYIACAVPNEDMDILLSLRCIMLMLWTATAAAAAAAPTTTTTTLSMPTWTVDFSPFHSVFQGKCGFHALVHAITLQA